MCGDPIYHVIDHLPVCGRCTVCPNCENTTRGCIYYNYTTNNWECEWCRKDLSTENEVVKEIAKYWLGRANAIKKHQKG